MEGLNDEILREVGMLARCIQTISDIKYRSVRLQRGQFIYLTRVCESPGINLIDLSNLLKVDKTTTTKAIQKLLKEGYVNRVRDAKDGRIWRLYPTKPATAAYHSIIQEENRYIEICFTGFAARERQQALGLVRRMRQCIEGYWREVKGEGEADHG